jgi:hypothetical protein
MKLNAYYKSCKKVNTIESKGILLRRDLEAKYGEQVNFQCKEYLQNNSVHPNQIFATSSKFPFLICTVIGLGFIIGGVIIKDKSGWSIIWTLLIGGVILSTGFLTMDGSNSKVFNKSFI